MFTIQMQSRFFAYFFVALLGGVSALAQTWPQTFQGQPDFDFSREEVVKELEKRKIELGFEPYIATVEDLMNTNNVDPFVLKPRYRIDKTGDQNVNPFLPKQLLNNTRLKEPEEVIETAAAEVDVNEKAPKLETQEVDLTVDFKAFEAMLAKVVEKNAQLQEPDLSNVNLSPELKKLRLQSITLSPQKYASINNRRYSEGDRFTILVNVKSTFKNITPILDAQMPKEENVSEENFAEYQKIREQAETNYTRLMNEKASKTSRHRVNVRVAAIESGRVVLQIAGRKYALKLKRSY